MSVPDDNGILSHGAHYLKVQLEEILHVQSLFLPAASPGAFPSPGAGNSQRNKWCFHPLLLDMADQQCSDTADRGYIHLFHTANGSRVTRATTVSLSSSLLFPSWSHKER